MKIIVSEGTYFFKYLKPAKDSESGIMFGVQCSRLTDCMVHIFSRNVQQTRKKQVLHTLIIMRGEEMGVFRMLDMRGK